MALNTIEDIEVTKASITPVDATELTDGNINGNGVFDILMNTVKNHIQKEYDAGRITGKEYATVYISAMTNAMQSAVQYILNSAQIDQITASIGLTRQQLVTELANTSDSIPVGLGFNNSTLIEGTVASNKAIAEKTATKTDSEITLLKQQTATELAQTFDTIPLGTALNTSDAVQGVISTNKSLTNKTITKTDSEIDLLKQKAATELAQTSDNIPTGTALNTSTSVTGVIGKQKGLFQKQTDGFDRDAEQKLAKIMVDTWAVRQTTAGGAIVSSNGLADSEINSVLNKAKSGIGV